MVLTVLKGLKIKRRLASFTRQRRKSGFKSPFRQFLVLKVSHRSVSKLLALQDIINNRDKECSNLETELKALKESKEELRVLLVLCSYLNP
jgi:hypothetical protein